MNLNVGCGGSDYTFRDLICEVNCDIQIPHIKIRNFIQCDARFLSFKDNVFQKVYAFNILEHIRDYRTALTEFQRVCNGIILIRFDKIYNLANWWTLDHEYIQHGKNLIPVPKIVELLRFMFRYPTIHNRIFRHAFDSTFPALRRIGLLDVWNYYCISPKKYKPYPSG